MMVCQPRVCGHLAELFNMMACQPRVSGHLAELYNMMACQPRVCGHLAELFNMLACQPRVCGHLAELFSVSLVYVLVIVDHFALAELAWWQASRQLAWDRWPMLS